MWPNAMNGIHLLDEPHSPSGARYLGIEKNVYSESTLLDGVDRIHPPSYFALEVTGDVLFQGNFTGGCDYLEPLPIVISSGSSGNGAVIAGSSDIFSDQGLGDGATSGISEPELFQNDAVRFLNNTIDWLAGNTASTVGTNPATEEFGFPVPTYATNGTVVGVLPTPAVGQYVLSTGNSAAFSFNASTRQISVLDATLLIPGRRFDLTFQIVQNSTVVGTAIAAIAVTWPNRPPEIDTPAAPFQIPENSLAGTQVGQLTVTDPDAGTHTWEILSGNTGGAFQIDNNGTIRVLNSTGLDFEVNSVFVLQVKVTDQVTWNPLTDVLNVTVNLQDIAIEMDTTGITSVVENSAVGTSVGTITTKDWSGTGPVQYTIRSVKDAAGGSYPSSIFSIVMTGACQRSRSANRTSTFTKRAAIRRRNPTSKKRSLVHASSSMRSHSAAGPCCASSVRSSNIRRLF